MTGEWSASNISAIIMSALAILIAVAALINIRRALRTVNRMITPPSPDQPQTSTGPTSQPRPEIEDPWLPKPRIDMQEEMLLPPPEGCPEPGCESESHDLRTSHIRKAPKGHLLWWT